MNATTLHAALAAAGLPVVACDSLGHVTYAQALTTEERETAAAILAAQTEEPSLASIRAQKLRVWNQAVNAFIVKFFDLGEQQSFAAIFADLLDQQMARPLTEAELAVKAALQGVKVWIEGVMAYYYEVKSQIEAAEDVVSLQAITGNFDGQFGAAGSVLPVPPVTLRQFFI